MVVLMHTPHPEAGVPGYVQVPLYFLTAAGLVLFFMVSGALLLPTSVSTGDFLRRRMGKIIGPWIFWTLFYMMVDYSAKGFSWRELRRLFVFVSSPGSHVMWFMFSLAGLYLLTPIISPFLKSASKKEIRFYLVIWLLTLCGPLLASIVNIEAGVSGTFYYFSGYVGYFILGYYLHKYGYLLPSWSLFLCFILPLGCLFVSKAFGGNGLDMFCYLSVFVAATALALFENVRRFKLFARLGGVILTELSNCSFGIYLMHIFIMRRILWNIDFITFGMGWVGQLIMTWVLTIAICFALTWVISFLPGSEYIVGYNKKRIK